MKPALAASVRGRPWVRPVRQSSVPPWDMITEPPPEPWALISTVRGV